MFVVYWGKCVCMCVCVFYYFINCNSKGKKNGEKEKEGVLTTQKSLFSLEAGLLVSRNEQLTTDDAATNKPLIKIVLSSFMSTFFFYISPFSVIIYISILFEVILYIYAYIYMHMFECFF